MPVNGHMTFSQKYYYELYFISYKANAIKAGSHAHTATQQSSLFQYKNVFDYKVLDCFSA